MTYSSGGLIQATDYNGFVSTNTANINGVWSTGTGGRGYGQSAVSTVSAAGTITAAQWSTLVSRISSLASHTNTSITSRSAPTAGSLIQILANVNTDITNVTTNRGNAAAVGSQYISWTGTSGKTGTTSGAASSIVFRHTVTWSSANAARYFWNAGGIVRWQCSKTSTGNLGDAEANDMASKQGTISITGRPSATTQTIAGVAYTGTTRTGGSGTPTTHLTTTGWYNLTTSNQTIWQENADTAPYTGNYIRIQAKTGNTGTTLDLTTTWYNAEGDTWSGGTAPSGITFGTAPATVVTYFPPSTTYLTNTWGTPTVVASVA